ncbi:MAG: hypothetical protein M3272_05065 [Actinomycetota bacterium]|nr:hypothetical protein [Actinomycetota bacterium]
MDPTLATAARGALEDTNKQGCFSFSRNSPQGESRGGGLGYDKAAGENLARGSGSSGKPGSRFKA